VLSAACPHFSNPAWFIRLPADFALLRAGVLRLAIGRVCQPYPAVSTILTEQTEFITAAASRFVLREQMAEDSAAFGTDIIIECFG
jgi:hypothetical protein